MDQRQTFDERIAAGEKVEPDDWMPDEYRVAVEKLVGFHAVAEVLSYGPMFYGWTTQGPTLRRKMICNAMIQDELGHGQIILRCWESLGKTYHDLVVDFRSGRLRMMNIFLYGLHTWAEIAAVGMFADSLELDRLASLQHCSYGPYARGLSRIVREEGFHFRQSCDAVAVIMKDGTAQQKADVQAAIDIWWPRVLVAYGPPDSHIDISSNDMFRWKLKLKRNDELRAQYLKRTTRLFAEWGLQIPAPSNGGEDYEWAEEEVEVAQVVSDQERLAAQLEQYMRYAELAEKFVTRSRPILPSAWRSELVWERVQRVVTPSAEAVGAA